GPSVSPLTRPTPNLPPPSDDEAGDEDDEAAASAELAPTSTPSAAPAPVAAPAPAEPAPTEEASRLVKGRSVPPFWIDRTYTTHRTRAMALPPLFFHRTGTAEHPEKFFHFNLSLTAGWYSKRTEKRRWLSPGILFFGSFSERTTAWGAVALLMGYKRV